MPIRHTNTIDIISTSGKSTYFVSWESYSLVQTGQKLIFSLDQAEHTVTLDIWKTPKEVTQLYENIHNRARTLRRQNLTTLRSIVDNNTKIVFEDIQPNFLSLGLSVTKKNFLEYFTYLSMAITFIYLGLMIVFKCCKRQRHTTRLVEALANAVIGPRTEYHNRPGPISQQQDIEDYEEEIPKVSAVHLPANQAFRFTSTPIIAQNPIYEATPSPYNHVRRALSYAYRV